MKAPILRVPILWVPILWVPLYVAMTVAAGCEPKQADNTNRPAGRPESAEQPAAKTEEQPAATTETAPKRPQPVLGVGHPWPDRARQASALNRKGLSFHKKKKCPQALELFRQAIQINPDSAGAVFNLACAFSLAQAYPQAVISLTRALRIDYPRIAPKLRTDPDLTGLIRSPQGPELEQARISQQKAWQRALSSPGAVVLLAKKTRVKGDVGDIPLAADASRGRAFFFHLASGRFLPLIAGTDAAGFALDSRGKKIAFIHWKGIQGETDTSPALLTGLAVSTLDLASLETTAARLPANATAAVLFVHEGKVVLRKIEYEPATAEESWATYAIEGARAKRKGTRKTDMTPIDLSGGEAEIDYKRFCRRRYTETVPAEHFIRLDGTCGDRIPFFSSRDRVAPDKECLYIDQTSRLCRKERRGSGTDLVLRTKTGDTFLLTADGIIQMGVIYP